MRFPPRFREIHAAPGPALDAVRRLDRTARMPALVDVSRNLPAILAGVDVLQVGTGSVGGRSADDFARLGVGTLRLVDRAVFKDTSLLTHACHPSDLGRAKVLVVGENAKAASPGTRVYAFHGPLEVLPEHELAGASVLSLSSDNLACEVVASEHAYHMGMTIIQSSVYGRTLSAQVRYIAPTSGDEGPCLRCFYGAAELRALDRGTRFSCEGAETGAPATAEPSRVPTASLPPLCAMAANLSSHELIRLALGIGDPSQSRLVEFNGYTLQTTVTPLRRRQDCSQDHARYRLAPRTGDLGACSPAALLRDAGAPSDLRRVTLRVAEHVFVTLATCDCAKHPVMGRFLRTDAIPERCRDCGAPLEPHPFHTRDAVPASELAGRLERPLADLGARSPGSVRVSSSRGTVLFHRRLAESVGPDDAPEALALGGAAR